MHEQETELTEMEPEETVAPAVEEPVAESSASAGEAPVDDEAVSRAAYEQLKAERDQLIRDRDQLLERLARLQAEFDNARKRAEREKIEFRDYATGNVVEQFLPVVDNFELALKSQGSADQLRQGVELIVKQMQEVLARLQVTAIPTIGEPFDPRQHEALGTVERDDIPDQHVAEEIRRGYKLRDRMLRPAMVRVAHNTKQVSE